MKALISPQQDNFIVEVTEDSKTFPVALPLYWVECPSNIKAYEFKLINNTFVEYTPEVIVPTVVSMRQARLALLQENLLELVEQAIANGSKADQITWEYATEVKKEDPLVLYLSSTLGLSKKQVDELFILASTL